MVKYKPGLDWPYVYSFEVNFSKKGKHVKDRLFLKSSNNVQAVRHDKISNLWKNYLWLKKKRKKGIDDFTEIANLYDHIYIVEKSDSGYSVTEVRLIQLEY